MNAHLSNIKNIVMSIVAVTIMFGTTSVAMATTVLEALSTAIPESEMTIIKNTIHLDAGSEQLRIENCNAVFTGKETVMASRSGTILLSEAMLIWSDTRPITECVITGIHGETRLRATCDDLVSFIWDYGIESGMKFDENASLLYFTATPLLVRGGLDLMALVDGEDDKTPEKIAITKTGFRVF